MDTSIFTLIPCDRYDYRRPSSVTFKQCSSPEQTYLITYLFFPHHLRLKNCVSPSLIILTTWKILKCTWWYGSPLSLKRRCSTSSQNFSNKLWHPQESLWYMKIHNVNSFHDRSWDTPALRNCSFLCLLFFFLLFFFILMTYCSHLLWNRLQNYLYLNFCLNIGSRIRKLSYGFCKKKKKIFY